MNFCDKTAHRLVARFDTIAFEKLNIKSRLKNHHLAESISDAGWGQFVSILTQKAESAARQVIAVTPAYTSQDCFGCGMRVPKKLSVRLHSCPYCGFEAHRDHNAALSILKSSGDTAFGETATLVAV